MTRFLIIFTISEQIDAFLADESLPAEASLDLASCNGYQRRIIYEQCEQRYDTKEEIRLESVSLTEPPHGRFVRVSRMTADKRASVVEERERVQARIEEHVGFRRVMDCISASRKPIIGHNMLLDMLHTHAKFFDAPFPPTAAEFGALLRSQFGDIYDTKLASISPAISVRNIHITYITVWYNFSLFTLFLIGRSGRPADAPWPRV